ncbi:MAG: cysteine-rich CWC family protein [Pseudomonas sp.]
MPADTERCPLCGQPNQCSEANPATAGGDCWCFSTPIAPEALARLDAEQIDKSCLCPNCARLAETPIP